MASTRARFVTLRCHISSRVPLLRTTMASNENASVEVDSDPKIGDRGEKRQCVNFKWTEDAF